MIKINILDEKEIKCYISRKYPDDKQNDAVISVNASEINNFFKGEDKNNWFVIEYLGPINSIANYLSLLTYKTFLKYFVEIILPECGTIEDAIVVTTELIRANAYEEADSILCVKVDSRLLQGEIGFRIIVPKYNYVDMWNKKNLSRIPKGNCEMIHKMKLNNEPYNQIMQGIKSVELRLYDEKRKKIAINDFIIFINTETTKQCVVKVLNLYQSDSFANLFKTIDREQAGFNSNDPIEHAIERLHKIYSINKEEYYGVLGIEISKPRFEMEFPIEIQSNEINHMTILPVYDGKLMLYENNSKYLLVPNGFANKSIKHTDEARRIFEEKTKVKNYGLIYPITSYRIINVEGEKLIINGVLYIADVGDISAHNSKIEYVEVAPLERHKPIFPELPNNIVNFDLFAIFIFTLQRLIFNNDLGGFCNVDDAECYDYTTRLKCYDDEVFFDYEHFDADAFAFYVMMRNDVGDIYEKLERVPATKENYKSIRDELFSVNSIEYVEWILDNFGASKILSDEELVKNLYENYDDEYINSLLYDEE